MALSRKQQAFIDHYVQCWNASEAARRADYAERSAGQMGHENLKKPEIQAEIQKRIDDLTLSADETLVRLGAQARSSMADFVTFDDNGRPEFDLHAAQQAGNLGVIRKLKTRSRTYITADENTVTETDVEVELYNAQTALELIGKHHKLFAEKLDVHHSGLAPFSADEAAEAESELDEWQPTYHQNGHA